MRKVTGMRIKVSGATRSSGHVHFVTIGASGAGGRKHRAAIKISDLSRDVRIRNRKCGRVVGA